jgi:hypothetical protein
MRLLATALLVYFGLAARKSISLAHVTGFSPSPSAAAWICCFSASVIGISIAAVLRSSGFLGGLGVILRSLQLLPQAS